ACYFDGVVRAAQDVPEAVIVHECPVAVHPHARNARPIGVEVALPVAPETARDAGPGLAQGKLAYLPTHGVALAVDHVGGHAWDGRAEGARLDREECVASQDAAGGLGAA